MSSYTKPSFYANLEERNVNDLETRHVFTHLQSKSHIVADRTRVK